jgi:hypothetical protein
MQVNASDSPARALRRITDGMRAAQCTLLPGGRERTRREFATLLKECGFELLKTTPTASPVSIFAARPI